MSWGVFCCCSMSSICIPPWDNVTDTQSDCGGIYWGILVVLVDFGSFWWGQWMMTLPIKQKSWKVEMECYLLYIPTQRTPVILRHNFILISTNQPWNRKHNRKKEMTKWKHSFSFPIRLFYLNIREKSVPSSKDEVFSPNKTVLLPAADRHDWLTEWVEW